MPHKNKRQSTNPKRKSEKNDEEKGRNNDLSDQPKHSAVVGFVNSKPTDISDSVYVRYKKSTHRFKEALQALVPSKIFESDHVHVLMDAADYVAENSLSIDEVLLQDLKFTIRVRKRIACDKFDGGDSGHSFFISVLLYCWSVLRPLCPRMKKDELRTKSSNPLKEEKSSFHNRFASLSIEIEDEDPKEEDSEEDLPQIASKPCRPQETTSTLPTLKEIFSATDLTDCMLFLLTMDEYMEFNCKQYSRLKEKCEQNIESKKPPSAIVRDLIQIGVTTNATLQRLSALEEIFVNDHPNLNTVYRFFASLIFPDDVQSIAQIVCEQSTASSKFSFTEALTFVSDALECSFRMYDDPSNKYSHLVRNFCQRWKIPQVLEVQKVFDKLFKAAQAEAPIKPLIDENAFTFIQVFSHSWLPNKFIGGKDRSIIHTLKLLQVLSGPLVKFQGEIKMNQGTFGDMWDDICKDHIRRIPIDMDELLVNDILQTLISWCKDGLLGFKTFPKTQEMLSLFAQIKLFIKYPHRPVTWTLAFAVHSIVSSIFEIQSSKSLRYIADAASESFNRYIQQMKWVQETRMSQVPNRPPADIQNLKTALMLEHFTLVPINAFASIVSDGQVKRALWNPVCAGCILTYLAYFGNIEMGSLLIDSVAQLRAWLHIYNALIQTGRIAQGEIPLLDFLYEKFEKCKAIWQGSYPQPGQFATRWLICFGLSLKVVKEYVSSGYKKLSSRNQDLHRTFTPIEPQLFVKSFQIICHRENPDPADKKRNDWEKMLATLDAIESDKHLLAINWTSLGFYLDDAFVNLFNDSNLMPDIDLFVKQIQTKKRSRRNSDLRSDSWWSSDCVKYNTFAHLLARLLFKNLDQPCDDLLEVKLIPLMKERLQSIPVEKVMWFDLDNSSKFFI